MKKRLKILRGTVDRAFDFRGVARWLVFGAALGVVAGVGAILFQLALEAARAVLLGGVAGVALGHPGGEPPEIVIQGAVYSPAWLLLLPALGGLAVGYLLHYLAPEARGHGTDAAIRAFHHTGGVIRKRVPLVKMLASIVTMGTGGSGGREGPIAQIGAGFGSFLATRLGLGVRYRRVMLASGLAAGVGAIFRAPLAGALFAAEVLYSDPEVETDVLLPAAITSIVAYAVYAARFGYDPVFAGATGLSFTNPLELGPYLLLGLVVTVAALGFIKAFYGIEEAFARLALPQPLKPALGGLLVGAVGVGLLAVNGDERVLDVMSTGYGALQDAIGGATGLGVGLLLLVAGGKILTTSLTIGSGGSAGVFGPSMVIGGTLGAAVGQVLHSWMPSVVTQPAAYAIVGMAGFFSAAAKAPLSTVVMVSELTGSYGLLVPAVWVCALSYLVSRRWSIYRSQVPSRLHSPAHVGDYAMEALAATPIRDVYKVSRRFRVVPLDVTVGAVLGLTAETRQRVYPVVDHDEHLLGCFHHADLMQALHADPEGSRATPVTTLLGTRALQVSPDDPVATARRLMQAVGVDELVVATTTGDRVLGIVTSADVLIAYNQRLARSVDDGEALPT